MSLHHTGWLLFLRGAIWTCMCTAAVAAMTHTSQNMSDDSLAAVRSWAAENGIWSPKLQPQQVKSKRGMIATRHIGNGKVMLSIPRSLALLVGQDIPSPIPDLLQEESWKQLPEEHQMACLLLWHVKQGTKSALHAWIQTLPRHSNNLVEWSPAQLDELQLGSGSAEADFRAQLAYTAETTKELFSMLRSTSFVKTLGITQQDLQWAVNCVYSRSFAVPKPFEWRKPICTSLAMLLAVLAFTYSPLKQWQHSGIMTWVATASLLVTLYPAARFAYHGSGSDDEASHTAMLPLVDFFNHDAAQEGQWLQTSMTGSRFQVSAVPEGFEAGQEATVSYGQKPNEAFLQFYGFVDTSYKSDFYSADLVEFIQHKQGIPEDRLALLNSNPVLLQATQSAALRTDMHGGLQRTTRQGLRFLAASPEDYQHILNKGKGRLQRALDWLEFHESSTIFTAFDYVKKADDTVHQVLYDFCSQTLNSKATTLKADRAELRKLQEGKTRDERKVLALQFRIGKKLVLQSCVKRHSEPNRVYRL